VDGAILSGDVEIRVSATDDNDVDSVSFYINGKRIGVDKTGTNGNFSFIWTTKSESFTEDAFHYVSVIAKDNSKNYYPTEPIQVKIDNDDNVPPTGNILFPYTGQTLNGIIEITLDVQDNDEVDSAKFYINNELRGSETEAPFSFTWDTALEEDDLNYSIYIVLSDPSANQKVLGPISILIDNDYPQDITFPVGTITYPSAGAIVNGIVEIQATATDDRGIASVEFYIDGILEETDFVEPYAYPWNSESASEDDEHIIAIIIADTTGNQTTPTPLAVIVDNENPEDNRPPLVSITQPSAGQTVSGTVSILALATDETGMDRVDFEINGVTEHSDNTSPYSFDWNTLGSSDDQNHIISVTGYDLAGNMTVAQAITVTVNNEDNEAPTGILLRPTPGQVVTGTISIEISAQDNVGVNSVSIYIDGAERIELTNAPYIYQWDTTSEAEDSYHAIGAIISDDSGNSMTIPNISVLVDNEEFVDIVPPTIVISNPSDGETVSGTISILATAIDETAMSRVEFLINGNMELSDSSSPYAYEWNSTNAGEDQDHIITAIAFDASNNSASTQITIFVNNDDNVFPTGTLLSPTDGQTLSGTVSIEVSAEDNVGVQAVEFFINDASVGTDSSSPYSFNWDTTPENEDAFHVIRVSVTDLSGNTTGIPSISVFVNNDDNVFPTGTLLSPTDGQTLSGTVPIEVSASDDVGVAFVSFTIDGSAVSQINSAPYTYNWDTTSETEDANHTIETSVTDQAGNTTGIPSISVFVNNDDNVFPTGTLLSPTDGQTLSGTVPIEVSASDDVGVAFVSFTIDGSAVSQINSAPYTYNWDTTSETEDANHTIETSVTDQAGNTTGIPSISVFVDNNPPPDETPPTITITNPTANDTLSGTVSITASAQDNIGVQTVEFFINSASVGTDATAPYTYSWNTSGLTNNSNHTLSAEATDAAGNSTLTTFFTVTVNNE
jgi:hypothetical protein